MSEFLMSGPAYFPGWVSILFAVGLALGIAHHLPCLAGARAGGPANRAFHAGHTTMALSMIYMYLSMSYDWNWLPAAWQMWFFAATSAAIAGYIAVALGRRQGVNLLWFLLLIQHAAMVYMWYPMMRWNAIAIFVLVSWFAAEAAGWVTNLLPDDVRIRQNRRWLPYRVGAVAPVPETVPPAPVAAAHDDGCECHTSGHLLTSNWKDRALMAVMAVSMGYMFYGMELMAVMHHSMMHHSMH